MNRMSLLSAPRRRHGLMVALLCLAIAVLMIGTAHAEDAAASSPAQRRTEQFGSRVQSGAHHVIDLTSRSLHRALDATARGTRRAAQAVQHAAERAKNSFHSA